MAIGYIGLGAPTLRFDFSNEKEREAFLTAIREQIKFEQNIKLMQGGTGGKAEKWYLQQTLFLDEKGKHDKSIKVPKVTPLVLYAETEEVNGLAGRKVNPYLRFEFRHNAELVEFIDLIKKVKYPKSVKELLFKEDYEIELIQPAKPEPVNPLPLTIDVPNSPAVKNIPIADIHTDTLRFQNRKSEFSEASVERIVLNYDPNKMDPITVWLDPADGKTYVLSGHSRLEAHKRLGLKVIPAKYFNGNESDAIRFAKVDANRSATAETLVEDIEAFRIDRDGIPDTVEPLSKADIKTKWKDKANKLNAYTYLDPKGQFIEVLAQPDLSQWPGIVNKAMWAGELRYMFPHLTNAHEDEMFNYLFKTGGSADRLLNMKKEDFYQKVGDRANSIRFYTDEPLALTKVSSGLDARPDTGPALARAREIKRRLEEIDKVSRNIESRQAKAELAAEKQQLLIELSRIDRDVQFLTENQNTLFGLEPDKEAELLAFIDNALTDKQSNETFSYGEVSKNIINKINNEIKTFKIPCELIDKPIELILTSDIVRHILNRHGKGYYKIDESDFVNIVGILQSSATAYVGERNGYFFRFQFEYTNVKTFTRHIIELEDRYSEDKSLKVITIFKGKIQGLGEY